MTIEMESFGQDEGTIDLRNAILTHNDYVISLWGGHQIFLLKAMSSLLL